MTQFYTLVPDFSQPQGQRGPQEHCGTALKQDLFEVELDAGQRAFPVGVGGCHDRRQQEDPLRHHAIPRSKDILHRLRAAIGEVDEVVVGNRCVRQQQVLCLAEW